MRYLVPVLIYLTSVGVTAFFQFQTQFLPETDSYFHITFALMMRKHGLFTHGFPWAQFSFWRDQFSDSCFLYHVWLVPFSYFSDLAFGAKLATVILNGAVFASFFQILRLNGSRLPALGWGALLLAGGELFGWRINVPRPQVLSVLLMLWSMHFLVNRKLTPFLAICFLYPFSYVAGFLPVFFALLMSLHSELTGDRPFWKFLLLGTVFCIAAYLFNPYFPQNLLMFWVQNFYVMSLAVTSGVQLNLGGEFYPITTRTLLENGLPAIAGFVTVLYLALTSTRKVSSLAIRWAIPTLIFILMTFISKRFSEYSTPFSFIWLSLALTELWPKKPHHRAHWASYSIFAIILIGSAARSSSLLYRDFRETQESPLKEAALFVKTLAKPGETILTCDWDNSPDLFFYNQEQRYLVMMDPTFMYYWNPQVHAAWRNAVEGFESAADTQIIFQKIFKIRYGICPQGFNKLHEIVQKNREFKILKETPGAYVFEVLSDLPKSTTPQ